MMVLPGLLAFVLFILFVLNKIRWYIRAFNALFAAGSVLLITSTVLCLVDAGFCGTLRQIGWLTAAVVCAGAVIYTLFFALPFHDTYAESGGVPVVATGVYGWCRHPSFWPFLLVYVCLWLGFGGRNLFWVMILYPTCNGLYIYIQDRWIFPQYIKGYDAYRQSVPFLIPRRKR